MITVKKNIFGIVCRRPSGSSMDKVLKWISIISMVEKKKCVADNLMKKMKNTKKSVIVFRKFKIAKQNKTTIITTASMLLRYLPTLYDATNT